MMVYRALVALLWLDSWSQCSILSGGGFQWRRGCIVNQQVGAGKPCPSEGELQQEQRCNAFECTPPEPSDCIAKYSQWSECSVPCGGGTQCRWGRKEQDVSNGDSLCPAPEQERLRNEHKKGHKGSNTFFSKKDVIYICAVVAEMDEINLVPLILILIIWLFAWAGICLVWDPKWGYLNAFYFVFLTFSTVGLGDVMPSGSKNMVWSYFSFFFALMLLSTIFAAIQAKVEAAFNRIRNAIILYYVSRSDEDSVSNETLTTGGALPPVLPRLTKIPTEVWRHVDFGDKLFYWLFMDQHRRRLLLERCRIYYRRRNARTQTGVLRKSSSEAGQLFHLRGDRARTPQKTVNFHGVQNRYETGTPPRIRRDMQDYSHAPAMYGTDYQQPVVMSPAARIPRRGGRTSPDPDSMSYTTAVTTLPGNGFDTGSFFDYHQQRRPTLASTGSDAMLNDFLFPEVNLVTRDPHTSRTLERSPLVDALTQPINR